MASRLTMSTSDRPVSLALTALRADLHALPRLRVWSLIVTFFGDAVLPRGGSAPLSVIQDAMGLLGVEPGAVRTALSRLAADGWVTRLRDGRRSTYTLAEGGLHAFDRATRRIYASGSPAWDGRWTVAVAAAEAGRERSDRMAALGFAPVGTTAWVRLPTGEQLGAEDLPSGVLLVTGVPDVSDLDTSALWPLADTQAAYSALICRLAPLHTALSGEPEPDEAQAMAARLVVNHLWRRVVLRDPGLPTALLPKDWPGHDARMMVRDLYDLLVPASEAWLDAAGLPPLTDPRRFALRFSGSQSSR